MWGRWGRGGKYNFNLGLHVLQFTKPTLAAKPFLHSFDFDQEKGKRRFCPQEDRQWAKLLKVDFNSCKLKVTYNDLNLTLIVIIALEHNIIACLFSDTVLYR